MEFKVLNDHWIVLWHWQYYIVKVCWEETDLHTLFNFYVCDRYEAVEGSSLKINAGGSKGMVEIEKCVGK